MMSSLRPLDKVDLDNVNERLNWADKLVYQSLMAATTVPDVRNQTISDFVGDPPSRILSYIEALIKVIRDEQRTDLIKRAAIYLFPGAEKLIAAAQFLESVNKKAESITHSYRGYGAEDRLFSFARSLREENSMFQDIAASINASADAISEIIQTS